MKMKIIDLISRLLGYMAMGMLGLMMLLTVSDVVMRYFFHRPITGSTELSEFIMVMVVFPAFAWVAVDRSHIRVDLLVATWPSKVQLVVEILVLILSFFTYAIVAWRAMIESINVETTSSLLSLPHAPFYWIVTVGFMVLCLAIVRLALENLSAILKKEKQE
jgi:TRAP-type C4-dicarboxylate transport system permease small subunit